jgi:hypothetical protein
MAADLNNEKLIARYLLGDLSEEQQVAIEDRAFADEDYLALVTAVENDLIDEYVRHELSANERQQFETQFLASTERSRRVEFAKALARVAVAASVPERTVVAEPAKWTWRDSLYAFLIGVNPAAKFAVVAVMLLLFVGGAWLLTETLRLRSQLTQLQAQNQARQNELNQQVDAERRRNEELNARLTQEQQQREQSEESLRQLSETGNATPERPVIASLILLPGLSRGGSGKPSLVLANDARLVRLQIGIDPAEPYKTFAVDLRTVAGRQVWTRENLTARTRGRARAISLTLPASALKSGDYELRLSGRQEGGESEDVGFYYFDVKKR